MQFFSDLSETASQPKHQMRLGHGSRRFSETSPRRVLPWGGGYSVTELAEWSYIEVRLSRSTRKPTSVRPWRSSTTSGRAGISCFACASWPPVPTVDTCTPHSTAPGIPQMPFWSAGRCSGRLLRLPPVAHPRRLPSRQSPLLSRWRGGMTFHPFPRRAHCVPRRPIPILMIPCLEVFLGTC